MSNKTFSAIKIGIAQHRRSVSGRNARIERDGERIMAYLKIFPIKVTDKKALDYITNPDKTDEKLLLHYIRISPCGGVDRHTGRYHPG